jgi:hypothetical protein
MDKKKGFSVQYIFRTLYISIEEEMKVSTVKNIINWLEAEKNKRHLWFRYVVLESWTMSDKCGNCRKTALSICGKHNSECSTKVASCMQRFGAACINLLSARKIPPYPYVSRCTIRLEL